MNTTTNSIAIPSPKSSYAGILLTNSPQTVRPNIIVLQPNGSLDSTSSYEFQRVLEESLEQASDGLIVDLLWVDTTDAQGVSALVAGIQRAAVLGKSISFQAMDIRTRAALEIEWIRQREISFGPRNDQFEQSLERFLDKWAGR